MNQKTLSMFLLTVFVFLSTSTVLIDPVNAIGDPLVISDSAIQRTQSTPIFKSVENPINTIPISPEMHITQYNFTLDGSVTYGNSENQIRLPSPEFPQGITKIELYENSTHVAVRYFGDQDKNKQFDVWFYYDFSYYPSDSGRVKQTIVVVEYELNQPLKIKLDKVKGNERWGDSKVQGQNDNQIWSGSLDENGKMLSGVAYDWSDAVVLNPLVDKVGRFIIFNVKAGDVIDPTLIDSFDGTDAFVYLYGVHPAAGLVTSPGQSFTTTGSSLKITSAKFYMKIYSGAPVANVAAVLYAHTGTYGSSSLPTGSILATSATYDTTALTSSYQLIEFTFSGAQQYVMDASTYYCIAVQALSATTLDGSNVIAVGSTTTYATHGGNAFNYENNWYASSGTDVFFFVYGDTPNNAPTNDACVSDATFNSGVNGWVNVTVSDADLVADLSTVDIQVNTTGDAETFTLRWNQTSGAFTETVDASNICTLGTGVRTNLNTTQDLISFQFSISGATGGACDVKATTTDDAAATDTDTYASEFTLVNNATPSNGATTISNMDDTNNLYAQKGLYTSTVVYTDTDGFADFDYVELRIKQGATNRAVFRYDEDTDTFSTPTGSTEWTLDGTSAAVESANTVTVTWQFTPQWDATEESDIEIEVYSIDAAAAADTDTAQTDYADVVTNLVTSFNLNDARGDISQSVTASGNVYYANDPASTTATTFYPPNAEFTGVSVYNLANTVMGTDTTIVNGAWSVPFTAPATVGTDTYNAYIAMADADYTDAEETPSAAYITDQLEITSTAASASRVGISTAFELRYVIKYSYDSVAFTGSTGSITGYVYDSVNSWWDKAETAAATVTSTTYDETSITATDSTYGITSKKDVAGVAVISDQIRVTDLGVLPNAAPSLGSSVTFYATADLQYDSHAVGLGDTLVLGGYTFTWTPENTRWELSHTEGDTATVTINTYTSGNEATYSITAGSINSKTVTASWGTTPASSGGGGGGGGGGGAPPLATVEVTGETTQTTDQVPIIPLYPQAPPDLMGAGLIGLIALVSVPFLLSWKNGGKKTVTQQFEKRLRDNQKTLLDLKMPDYESFWKKKS